MTAQTPNSSNYGVAISVDAWGNLTNKNALPGKNVVWQLNKGAATNKNQFTDVTYDAAGNVTADGASYTYDAENRIVSTGGVTYTYDGDGERVKKSNGTLYWTGTGSAALLETTLDGTAIAEYVFFNGKRVARIDRPSAATHYYLSDHIGSTAKVTNATGTIEETNELGAYGELLAGGNTRYLFTGKERDTGGEDYFGARYYAFRQSRFLTPDWSAAPVPVPYAALGSPQTLNLYAYVQNNPITGIDPEGHLSVDEAGSSGGTFSQPTLLSATRLPPYFDYEPPPPPAPQPNPQATQSKKPLTPEQIKKAFYKQHGNDMNAAVKKVFGKDASKVPAQTPANAPKLNTSKSRTELAAMKGSKVKLDGFNHPDMSQYPAGPIPAENGIIYISSDLVKSGDMPEIFGTYAHELANLLDMQLNAKETTYGDQHDSDDDPDTGQQVEKTMFPK